MSPFSSFESVAGATTPVVRFGGLILNATIHSVKGNAVSLTISIVSSSSAMAPITFSRANSVTGVPSGEMVISCSLSSLITS